MNFLDIVIRSKKQGKWLVALLFVAVSFTPASPRVKPIRHHSLPCAEGDNRHSSGDSSCKRCVPPSAGKTIECPLVALVKR